MSMRKSLFSVLSGNHKNTQQEGRQVEQSNLSLQAFLMNDAFKTVFHLSEFLGVYDDAQLFLLKFLEQQRTWF